MTAAQLERLQEHLQRLRLFKSRERLEALLQEATGKELTYADFLDQVLTEEVASKTAKHVTMRTQLARFPFVKGLDAFDVSYQPSLDKKQLQTLSTCHFIEHGENLVILGPRGVGKSHLAAPSLRPHPTIYPLRYHISPPSTLPASAFRFGTGAGQQMFEFHETTIAPLVECPTATGKWFWGAWTDLAASYAWRGQKAEAAAVVELLKVRPDFTVETLEQDGAQYSDNPTFRKQFQRIVEGARTAGLPER